MINKKFTVLKTFVFSLIAIVFFTACGGSSGEGDSTSISFKTTTTTNNDETSTEINDVEGENELCMIEVYDDGKKLDACIACHFQGGLAGDTDLILKYNDAIDNYNSLKSYLAAASMNPSFLVNKVKATSPMEHVGGKFSDDISTYLQSFVDAYENQGSCLLSDDMEPIIDDNTDNETNEDDNTDTNTNEEPDDNENLSNESCLEEVYDDGARLNACATCHLRDGLAGSTQLVFIDGNKNYNYEVLKDYLASASVNSTLLVNKINASSSAGHVGGKFSSTDVNYLQNFVDAYANQDSCTLTDTDDNTDPQEDTDTNDETQDDTSSLDGHALYTAQCASCHGDNGEGGFGGPFFIKGSAYQTQHTMVAYLTQTMPLTDVAACGTDCSQAIYTYAKANFYDPNNVDTDGNGGNTGTPELVCQDGEISTSPQYLRLLSSKEYKNSVRDLLGFTSIITDALPADSVSGNFKNSAISSISDTSKMEAYLNVALNLSEESINRYKGNIISCSGGSNSGSCSLSNYVAGTSYSAGEKIQHKGRYFECSVAGWCSQNHAAYEPGIGFGSLSAWNELNQCPITINTPVQDTTNEQCTENFVRDFGKRVYRRPLLASEQLVYVNMIESSVSFDDGLKDVLASMLVSPNFLYRSEVGIDTQNGYAKLSPYETASALSYLLWGSIPDDELLNAAQNSGLNSPSGIKAQAQRMLNDDKAKEQIVKFTSQWLHTDIDSIGQKASNAFNISGVKESLVSEFEALTQYAIFDGTGKFSEMIDGDYFFANDTLDNFYQLDSTVTGSSMKKQSKVIKNGDKIRGGLLRTGAFLASHGQFDETGALARGAFIRREILCQQLPIPPVSTPTFDTTPPVHDNSITTRELFDKHTESAQCYTCHKSFNDLGFAFENYKGDGTYRQSENGLTIIQSGTLLGLRDRLDGISIDFEDKDALIDTLANEDALQECYATQYFRFAKGYIENEQDSCAVGTLKQKFVQSGGDIKTLMIELTQLPSFVQRAN